MPETASAFSLSAGGGFSTRAIHTGQAADAATGAVIPPLYLTSTYAQSGMGKHKGYTYSRVANPTRHALESCLAGLEGGAAAHAFSSGMAAIQAVLLRLKTGDHIVCARNVYGGTARLLEGVMSRFGLTHTYADTTDARAIARAWQPNTRYLWVETPSNPCLEITDLAAMATLAHARGALLVADNTFMSPYGQRPLAWGADLVVHSTTKYLNGHSDGLGGAVIAAKPALADEIGAVLKAGGGILSPFECFLVLRGIKTLAVRMERHAANALELAQWLAGHPRVKKVYYPGLATHPRRPLARRQMRIFGGMLAIETTSLQHTRAILKRLRLCTFGESLGGVETLVSHPTTMSHFGLSRQRKLEAGVTDRLLRISVGLEDVADIKADLEQALR